MLPAQSVTSVTRWRVLDAASILGMPETVLLAEFVPAALRSVAASSS